MDAAERRARLLVVDDEPLDIAVLGKMLGDTYEVLAALSGEEALLLSAAYAPDLVLLDVSMPGMDGYEVCRRLKANDATRDIPVIFMTALKGEEPEVRGLELGASDYLRKTLSPALLRLRIRHNLELKSRFDGISRHVDELREVYERQNEEIRKARLLTAAFTICCTCKKIRDEHGHWTKLENFMSVHYDIYFSHGYCPSCALDALDGCWNG